MTYENEITERFNVTPVPKVSNDLMQAETARVMAEVQGRMLIAQRWRRNSRESWSKIMDSCKRISFAEQALYAYPRGNQVVTGPSIRLIRVIAQHWGNLDFGIKELSQTNGVSIAQAYAWDLETNIKETKEFQVPHKRFTKKGATDLVDSRDIYELIANLGARRLRACLEGIIPADIIEDAENQCKLTLQERKEPIEDRIKKLIAAFNEVGIKVPQIEKRLGHNLEATIEPELVTLRSIYKSIKDGVAKREDFFEFENAKSSTNEKDFDNKADFLAEKLKEEAA